VSFPVDNGKGGQTEKVVRPEECISESESPGVILIFDTPTVSHIPSLLSSFQSPFFSRFQSSQLGHKDFVVRAAFHICGPGVLEHEEYKAFMNAFPSTTYHIISSKSHQADPVTFTSASFNQLQLNQLDEAIFPIPKFRLEPKNNITGMLIY
jgi:ribonuclease Z